MLFGFFYLLLFIGEEVINNKMQQYIQEIKFALKNKFGNPNVMGYVKKWHEYTHLQLHGNFDNYTLPGKSMFDTAFYSVTQTLLENKQLNNKQNCKKC